MGTAKVASIAGSATSSVQYARRVPFRSHILGATAVGALIGSFLGARLISFLHPAVVKPAIFVLLIGVFLYMLFKKDFGQSQHIEKSERHSILHGSLFGLLIGLYDGFLGPGAGSFLILFFVGIIGFDFLQASAHAKVINFVTNLGALIYFAASKNVLWHIALPMAAAQMIGSFVGVRAALLRGNQFIRYFFLAIMGLMILRYGYDLFLKN
jgi:uncharacterized membrane protein YfcA